MITWYAVSGAIEQGLVYGMMSLGVFMTFRLLDFPDLTVDGSLPLGAAVGSVCLAQGMPPFLALIPAAFAGFLAGSVTGILNTKFKILHLLASILTMTALYSVNIRIMGGPNLPLLGLPFVFSPLIDMGITSFIASPLVFGAFALVAGGLLYWFIQTETGQALIATGDNPTMIKSMGVNTHSMIILGVGLSNAMVAVSGALIAQNQGAADVNMGVGTIVAGLASIVVGETLFGSRAGGSSMGRCVVAVVLGSVVYRLAIAFALGIKVGEFSFQPSDLNLITSILVVFALILPQLQKRLRK